MVDKLVSEAEMLRIVVNKMDNSFNLVRQIPLEKLRGLERSKKTVKDLNVGSVLKYLGDTYLVTDKYSYYENKKDIIEGQEFQITDVITGDIKYLEYSEDDTVEIFMTTREVSTKEIAQSLPDTNHKFIRDEVKDFTLRTNRTSYYYDDDWKSRFVRFGKDLSEAEVVRMVEFESEDEMEYLTFEYWEDESMEVFISHEIKSYELEILSL